MDNNNMIHHILMGEFPLSLHCLDDYSSESDEIRLFEGETLDHNIIDKYFLLCVKYGRMAFIISRPDQSIFRFLTIENGATFFANSITPYTQYSQSWDIKSLENTILWAFTKEQFFKLLMSDSTIANEYLDFTFNYHTIVHKRTLLTASLSSSQRVLTWLFALCECHQEQSSTYIIPCTLNQKEISDILILHISTCNKIFSWLEENEVAKKTKNNIQIDYPKLQDYISKDWKIY